MPANASRRVVLAAALSVSGLLSGVAFGWAALVVMMKREGAYAQLCDDDDDDDGDDDDDDERAGENGGAGKDDVEVHLPIATVGTTDHGSSVQLALRLASKCLSMKFNASSGWGILTFQVVCGHDPTEACGS